MFLTHTVCAAWDGYDYEAGRCIEIEKGNLVHEGSTIEVFDYGSGGYRDVDIESINRTGSTVELEAYDAGSDEYRTFEMED